MIFPQNITEIQSFNKHQVVSIDVYGMSSSDFVFLTIDTIPGAFLLSVGMIRLTRIRTVSPGGVQIFLFPIVNIDAIKDPLSDFIFQAALTNLTNYNGVSTPVIFDQVDGNVSGNYDNVTGLYTFNAAVDGRFVFQGDLVDNAGSGATTIQIQSDLQGVLTVDNLPNNTAKTVELAVRGSFVNGEVVNVEIIPGDTDILADAFFMFEP